MREEIENFKENLFQQRDEIRLQLSLAKMEAKDEWEKVEEMLDQFSNKVEAISSETKDASEDVWGSVKVLGEEIKTAFDRIKKQL